MADLNDFLPSGGGGFQIGAIVAAATVVTEERATLLPCDGSEYLGFDYPLLMERINPKYVINAAPLLGIRTSGALSFSPSKVEYNSNKSKLYAWNRDKIAESIDHGVTWTNERLFTGLPGIDRVVPVKGQFTDRLHTVQKIHSATGTPTTWYSDDYGVTWTQVNIVNGIPNGMPQDLIVSPDGIRITIFGIHINDNSVNAVSSTNAGLSFGNTGSWSGSTSTVYHPREGGNAFIGNNGGIIAKNIPDSGGIYTRNGTTGQISNSAYANSISPGSHHYAWVGSLPDGSGLIIANWGTGVVSKWVNLSSATVIATGVTGLSQSGVGDEIKFNSAGDMLFNRVNSTKLLKAGSTECVNVYGEDVLFQSVGGIGFASDIDDKFNILNADDTFQLATVRPYSFTTPDIYFYSSSAQNAQSTYNNFLYIVGDEQI